MEIEVDEMETERKYLVVWVIEMIANAVIIEWTIVDGGQLFHLPSGCRIEGKLCHLSAQARSSRMDPGLHQIPLSCRLHWKG